MTFQELIAVFGARGRGGKYVARCPRCGKDKLYLTDGGGSALLFCQHCNNTGATTEDVTNAAGLKMQDLYYDNGAREIDAVMREIRAKQDAAAQAAGKDGAAAQAVRTVTERVHVYQNADGADVFRKTVKRKFYADGSSEKYCPWDFWNGAGWKSGRNKQGAPLYHLPALMKAQQDGGGVVFVVEGEKDVETMERLHFSPATTLPDGANTREWSPQWSPLFVGAQVVIVTDNDTAGRKYGQFVADKVYRDAAAVYIVPSENLLEGLAEKGDISDIAAQIGDDETAGRLSTVLAGASVASDSEYRYTPPKPQDAPPQAVQDVPPVHGDEDDPQATTKRRGRKDPPPIFTLAAMEEMILSRGEQVRRDTLTGKITVNGYNGKIAADEIAANYVAELWEQARQEFIGISKDTVQNLFDLLLSHKDVLYNSALEWILSRPWDGIDRVQDVLRGVLKIPENDQLSPVLVRKWFWQGIALLHNGTTYGADGRCDIYGADGILVLVGAQGCGKSSFFRHIAGGGNRPEWYLPDGQLDNWDKDKERRCVTKWICELGEIQRTFTRADAETMKQFITREKDTYRLPYARADIERVRFTNVCATVNPDENGAFLIDRTGNRRYWTVQIPDGASIDFQCITPQYAQQLWRQAYDELMGGGDMQAFRLTAEERAELEERNGGRVRPPQGAEIIAEILEGYRRQNRRCEWYTVSQWKAREEGKQYGGELRRLNVSQVGIALNRLNVESKTIHGGVKVYLLPNNTSNVGGTVQPLDDMDGALRTDFSED